MRKMLRFLWKVLTFLPRTFWKMLPAGMKSSRFSLVVLVLALAALSVLVILAAWLHNWRFGLPTSTDKATRINTIVAASAFIAALVGIFVALIAYWQASGRALLVPEVVFPGLPPNELVFDVTFVKGDQGWPTWVDETAEPFGAGVPAQRTMLARSPSGQLAGSVELRNDASYAARNPGLRIEFDGLLCQSIEAGWQTTADWDNFKNGHKAIQWDGGTEQIVHAKWSRFLPRLNFNEIIVSRVQPPPKLIVTVVADGCRIQTKTLEVTFRQNIPYRDLHKRADPIRRHVLAPLWAPYGPSSSQRWVGSTA